MPYDAAAAADPTASVDKAPHITRQVLLAPKPRRTRPVASYKANQELSLDDQSGERRLTIDQYSPCRALDTQKYGIIGIIPPRKYDNPIVVADMIKRFVGTTSSPSSRDKTSGTTPDSVVFSSTLLR
jgi:hypothetical protein